MFFRHKRVAVLAVVSVVAGCMAAAGFHVTDSYLDPFDDRPFDFMAWAEAGEQQRGPMARDAIRHLPTGLPAAGVRELLGKPEAVVDRRDAMPGRPETWSYGLGCWSGLGPYGFDSASLDIGFDTDGRVVAAKITGS